MTDAEAYEALLFRLTPILEAQGAVAAAWVEGEGPLRAPPPAAFPLRLHVGTPDPDFAAAARELPELLRPVLAGSLGPWADAPFEGLEAAAELPQGRKVVVTLERMSLVGKRPRRCLRLLVDKTGRFLGGLTFAAEGAPRS